MPTQIVIYHPIFINNCNNVFLPVLYYWSSSGREATIYYIVCTRHNQLKTDYYQDNKIKYISALGHINNTAALIFRHIQCLHLIYTKVACLLVSLGTQVQPQIILDPDYLPDYLSVSYDYGETRKKKFISLHKFSLFFKYSNFIILES